MILKYLCNTDWKFIDNVDSARCAKGTVHRIVEESVGGNVTGHVKYEFHFATGPEAMQIPSGGDVSFDGDSTRQAVSILLERGGDKMAVIAIGDCYLLNDNGGTIEKLN